MLLSFCKTEDELLSLQQITRTSLRERVLYQCLSRNRILSTRQLWDGEYNQLVIWFHIDKIRLLKRSRNFKVPTYLFPTYTRRCCRTPACLHNSIEVYLYSIHKVPILRSEGAGLHTFNSEQGKWAAYGFRPMVLDCELSVTCMLVLNIDFRMLIEASSTRKWNHAL